MYDKKIKMDGDSLTRFKCECGSDEFISEPNSYEIVIVEDVKIKIDHREIIETSKYYCRECGKEYEEIDGRLFRVKGEVNESKL